MKTRKLSHSKEESFESCAAYHSVTCSIALFVDCFECDRKHLCVMYKHEICISLHGKYSNAFHGIVIFFCGCEIDSLSYNSNGNSSGGNFLLGDVVGDVFVVVTWSDQVYSYI